MRALVEVDGHVDAAFEGVRDAFRANFSDHNELGGRSASSSTAASSSTCGAGTATCGRRRAWARDTLVDVFSVGKGLLATGVARLVGQGRLDLDAPVGEGVARLRSGGQGRRHAAPGALAHRAGCRRCAQRLAPDAMLSPPTMRRALADEAPWWAPGTAHGYHVNTFGFLVGAVIERVTGRRWARTCARRCRPDRQRPPRGARRSRDLTRVAEFRWPLVPPPEAAPEGLVGLELMRYNSYWNPSGLSGAGVVNTEAWRRRRAPVDQRARDRAGRRPPLRRPRARRLDATATTSSTAARSREATTEAVSGEDLVLERPSRFGLGFQLTHARATDRPLPAAASATSVRAARSGSAIPRPALAFGYVTSDMGPRWQNPRNRGLAEAVLRRARLISAPRRTPAAPCGRARAGRPATSRRRRSRRCRRAVRASTTGRWRIRRSVMSAMSDVTSSSGEHVVTGEDISSPHAARERRRPRGAARTRTTSRSEMMPSTVPVVVR